ncbi:hypothetical protein [Rhizobium sp. BK176]|uniref:hypothetical protein n=1 Tax=Rhizobium sp. BK176 TaxID=2587071 RepID=UPI002168B186|nr:hypothetical protein [Rhizobium sp. BK176]MCS4089311.1 hypothetical protein [Rhizobium sp. BK176]
MPRVRLPYCYEASFIKNGRKTVHEGYLHGEVAADVPELSRGDVRVVAEWSNHLFPDDGPLNRTKFAHSKAVSWNGGLYVPAGEDMEDDIPAEVIAKTLDVMHDELWCYKAIYNYETACNSFSAIGDCIRGCDVYQFLGISPFGRQPKKPTYEANDRILNENADAHRAIVQDIANSLAFIDGTVWKRVPSIQLRLNVNEGAAKAWVTVVHGAYGYNEARGLRNKWDVDRHLHHRFYALNEIGRLLKDVGPGIDVSWRVSRIEIHDVDAIRFNGASNYAARAMESAVMAHANQVGLTDQGWINDWLALRTAVERHREFPDDEMSQQDVERMFRLLDADGDRGPARAERARRYIGGYRSESWDRNTLMPALGHHDSGQWLS